MKNLDKNSLSDNILLYLYLYEQFNKLQIDFSEKQIRDIVAQLSNPNHIGVRYVLEDSQIENSKFKTKEDASKKIAEVIDNIKFRFEKFMKNNKDLMDVKLIKLADKFAIDRVKELHLEVPKHFTSLQEEHKAVKTSINEIWGYALDILDILISSSVECITNLNAKKSMHKEENQELYDALSRLHGRACQVSYETLTLLRAGYADGAYARSRTLYETLLISYFLTDNGNEAAKRYLDFNIINSKNEAGQFNEYAEILGEKPISSVKLEQLEKQENILLEEYGSDFNKGDYGWASLFLNKKRPSFKDIEEATDFTHMRPHYKSASNSIHAGSSSLYSQLSLPNEYSEQILMGPSNYGIGTPCYLTANFINMITANLMINESQTFEDQIQGLYLSKLRLSIEEYLEEVERNY